MSAMPPPVAGSPGWVEEPPIPQPPGPAPARYAPAASRHQLPRAIGDSVAQTAVAEASFVLAYPLAVVAVAASEALRVPAAAYLASPGLLAEVVVQAIAGVCATGAGVLFLAALTIVGHIRRAGTERWRVAWVVVGAIGAGVALGFTVTTHPSLVRYSALLVGLGLGAPLVVVLPGVGTSGRCRATAVAATLALGGSVVVGLLNPHVTSHYAAVNVALAQAELLLAYVGIAGLLHRSSAKARIWQVRAGWAGVGLVFAATAATASLPDSLAAALYRAHTMPGLTERTFAPGKPHREAPLRVESRWFDHAGAERRFLGASGLPSLPASLTLDDYNVLLILFEATRYDMTTFADPKADLTPNLQALGNNGAFCFSRAYAASSGTLHSVASILAAGFPSTLNLATWRRAWNGRLSENEPRVAEAFSRARYRTWWLGHDYKQGFGTRILGLQDGFQDVKLLPAVEASVDTDRHLADELTSRLHQAARRAEKFFGWVFFVSPHYDYVAHFDTMPSGSPLDRYRQEIRYLDEQLGRVVAALRATHLLERTILILSADHGEEFGEHGGTHHMRTVYDETVQVPLVVWIPGVAGRRIDRPTSVVYTLPWLMLKGSAPLQQMARSRIEKVFVPIMRASRNAVPVELIGHELMKTALVWPNRKVVYDFYSDLVEVYDPLSDPGEQRDLALTDTGVRARGRASVEGYLAARAHLSRFTLAPHLSEPAPRNKDHVAR